MLTPKRSSLMPLILLFVMGSATAQTPYFPDRNQWQSRSPDELGFNTDALDEAIAWARSQAQTEPSDLYGVIYSAFAPNEPDFRLLGPVRDRAGDSGMIIRNGYIAASWGDLQRADMTFSVAKSYLSTMAALALADGDIHDLDDRVQVYVQDGHFDDSHNSQITWRHLLNQTSDWSGTLWDIHDWADRPAGNDPEQWPYREKHTPGTHYKYNDVRVNMLAYALLQTMRVPLPVVLRERIMSPIGASNTWRWTGYENSWVTLDGQRVQSVSGGGHFGGGMFISTEDHARFGLLFLRRGNWNGEQLFPSDWIDTMTEPTPVQDNYGFMWWLNTDRASIPAAPASAYWASGFGGNYIYIDEENDLVIVMRWIPRLQGAVTRILEALEN